MNIYKEKANELIAEFRRNKKDLPPIMSLKQAKTESTIACEQIILGYMQEIDFYRNVIKSLT
jgi:hypothetical protein